MIVCMISNLVSQIKFIVEDFEGLENTKDSKYKNGWYEFGKTSTHVKQHTEKINHRLGEKYLTVLNKDKVSFGGFGKTVNHLIELRQDSDYINFYIHTFKEFRCDTLTIEILEDDNNDEQFEKDKDDLWEYSYPIKKSIEWQLVSIPLNLFSSESQGGNNIFDVDHNSGRLIEINFNLQSLNGQFGIDFITFSDLDLSKNNSKILQPGNGACLGLWAGKNSEDNFTENTKKIEQHFKNYGATKKMGIVHLFVPFFYENDEKTDNYFSVEKINNILHQDYIPMITLESRFGKVHKERSNLKKIIEGKYDPILENLANRIKKVDGMVLLRILHEFNGDWYPWSISKNNNNPEMLKAAFIHMHQIFQKENVENVKFIWCPNSTSIPQKNWNFMLEAYPGDEYVDFTGIDIYNGAGKSVCWKSFLMEGIEAYYLLNENFPNKPILICETASREKNNESEDHVQTKKEWIRQMSLSLKQEMKNVKLLCWFNETQTFPINSSKESEKSYYENIISNSYFKEGVECIYDLLR